MYKEVNGRWGPCKFLAKDEYVGRSMYYYGEYNPDETEKILELAAEGKGVCLDIGANIGVISQALLYAGNHVVAFEPQPELFSILQENMAHYTDSDKAAYNVACGDKNGTAIMPKVYYSTKGNFGGLGIGQTSMYGGYEVPVVTIDSYLWFNKISFIKIDVEGYEYETLVGATQTINRCKPILYIEDDRTAKSVNLRRYITDELGYTIEEHRPALYREENFFGLKKNVWNANYASHNLICRPV